MKKHAAEYPIEVWYVHALIYNGVCLFVIEPQFFLSDPLQHAGKWHLHRFTVNLN